MSREASRLMYRYASYPHRVLNAANHSSKSWSAPQLHHSKQFHSTAKRNVVKPYMLADIGEGITECQVIQWFVKPGARVEQFDPICEVQSDKASVEITSRFDGVIKKLYYEPDDMAKVGKPLIDIDIQSEILEADKALLKGASENETSPPTTRASQKEDQPIEVERNDTKATTEDASSPLEETSSEISQQTSDVKRQPGKHASLATPAVRHLIKQLDIRIEAIQGTGKDGRVLKEDVQRFSEESKKPAACASSESLTPLYTQQTVDHIRQLTPIQSGMFKQMTKSLSIPHFLYTDGVDFTALSTMRKKFNANQEKAERLSPLPFIIKAVSLALQQHPLLNAHLDTTTNVNKPQLHVKGSHDIGLAVDSPAGLLVPVIKNVQSHSIQSLATEVRRLSNLAKEGRLTTADLSGATFTLSSIGSIGGAAVAPVITTPQVAILGVGRAKAVPAFDENGELVRKEECVFSWSADHRVIDGAMAARCAATVKDYLENIERMLVSLR